MKFHITLEIQIIQENGKRFRGKEEGGNGGKKPKQQPSLFDYIILILDSFFPFIKHNSVCRFSAVYKENMRYADA